MPNNCVFCRIVSGELPAERIYDDERVVAILDLAPANKGHALVIPKKHYKTFEELTEVDLQALIAVAKKVARGMLSALHADGVNVHINSGRAAGQLIDHAHIHVLPRFKDDGLAFGYDAKKYADQNEMRDFAQRIRKAVK